MTTAPALLADSGAPLDLSGRPALSAGLVRARPDDHVIGIQGLEYAGVPVVSRAADGSWHAGPYAGDIEVDGEWLTLRPVMGDAALEGWLRAAVGLDRPPSADAAEPSTARLAGLLWARSVDDASRHGPPAFRREVHHTGGAVRGRLDVRTTVRMRARGESGAASIFRARELDNAVTRIIVAADRVLRRRIADDRWRTDRVNEIIPVLHGVVGRRAPVPTEAELRRMRFTPITRPFKWTAALSSHIVRQDPVFTTAAPGWAQGVLLDLASIWAGAVLVWARAARPDLRIEAEAGVVVARGGSGHEAVRLEIEALRGAVSEPLLVVRAAGAEVEHELLPTNPADAALAVARLAARL